MFGCVNTNSVNIYTGKLERGALQLGTDLPKDPAQSGQGNTIQPPPSQLNSGILNIPNNSPRSLANQQEYQERADKMANQPMSDEKGPHLVDPNKKTITQVHKTGRAISEVMFDDGTKVDVNTAIQMAEENQINDVNSGSNVNGMKTLRSYPDGDPTNNLGNLPQY
jgi:hypothetical protein